jgi:hypothetical protein
MRINAWRIFLVCASLAILAAIPSGSLSAGFSPDGRISSLRVLTLDDRPPNYLMLQQVGAIAGVYIDLALGGSIQSDERADLAEFDLISLNAAAAGSLVGSRTADPYALQPPLINPGALVHFAVPRAQPTVTDAAILKEYQEVMKTLEKPDVQKAIAAVAMDAAPGTGNEYLDIYAFRLKGWLDFLDRANINPDRLLITLDDNRPGPLADRLKLELGKYSHHVMDGTDEGMMLLLARFLREHQPQQPPAVGLIWTAPGDLLAIAPHESALVAENLLAELDWLNARVTSRLDMLDPWRPVLWVSGAGSENGRKAYISEAMRYLGDRHVVVADITVVNGADDLLMHLWREQGAPPGLVGYLGWNTASNTIGSAVALWMAIDYGYAVRSDPVSVQAAAEIFLWSRLLDDWLYQGVARAELRSEYASQGSNIWDLTDDEAHRAASEIAARLVELWREEGIRLSLPLRIVKPLGDSGFIVELPWNRFFEIELSPTDSRGWVPQITPIPETR